MECRLEEIAPTVFQCQCLNEIEADGILREVRQVSKWEAGPIRTTSTHEPSYRDDVRLAWEIREDVSPEVFASFRDTVRGRVTAMAAQLSDTPLELADLRLVRYDEGGFFKVHLDAGRGDRRRFAIVIYLNDDFDGGNTIFPLLGIRSAPRKGKAVVFSTERLHRGDVVTGGRKFILVTWLLTPAASTSATVPA
jgi:Rps23 Pro-64 3,4-dihydroxylase Tpa1-like proline 4-hydroxylase